MSLPPLPERNIDHTFDWSYTEQQMREYGQLCRKRALEEAAAMCESKHANGNHKYDTREECAEAIRGMT